VVRLAREVGLSGLALTDHDTVDGIAEAIAEAAREGIDFIAGIEISAQSPTPGTLHILGYGVDPASAALRSLTDGLIADRDARNPRIIAKLNELGVAVTIDEWLAEAGGGVVGRPHLATILVRKGYATSVKNAFDKYIGAGAPAYVDRQRLRPSEALRLINDSGGLAVLAHPFQLRTGSDAELERVVKDLVDLGLSGIEVLHSDHDDAWISRCEKLAAKFGLLRTGGSDFHGAAKPGVELGRASGKRVPREYFDRLRERLSEVRR
jgi:predicted metal-dependent phosphoesterase TrpH